MGFEELTSISDNAEIIQAGKAISGEISFGSYPQDIQYEFPKKVPIKDIEIFCRDNGYVHDTMVALDLITNPQTGEKHRFYQVNIGVKQGTSYISTGSLLFDETKKNVVFIKSASQENLDKLKLQVYYTNYLDNSKNQDFVEYVRSDQKLNIKDKQKIFYTESLFEYIDSKYNINANNNLTIVGEAHNIGLSYYTEVLVQKYLEHKDNQMKLGVEITFEKDSAPTSMSNYKIKGISLGIAQLENFINKNPNVIALDKKVADPKSENGYIEREKNFVNEILKNSPNSNMLCVIGADHMIIAEELKAWGKNVILIAPAVDQYDRPNFNEPYFRMRDDYFHKNSQLFDTFFGSLESLKKLEFAPAEAEAEKTFKLYMDEIHVFQLSQKAKQNVKTPSKN